MAKSMTGFGRGDNLQFENNFIVEIRSVNHKFNDISVKLPRTMLVFEDKIKKAVSCAASRGKIDVFVNYESLGKNDSIVEVNTELLDSYVSQLRDLKSRYNINDDISLDLLVKLEEAFVIEKSKLDEAVLWDSLSLALGTAIENFLNMRIKEGEALKADILVKCDKIEKLVLEISEKSTSASPEYYQKLKTRILEMLSEALIDENRIIMEAAIIADKACIDEEITRLNSHLSQLRTILEESEPIGRKLDFLIQEMMRESNTIASKSNDLGITNTTVLLKTEIEKIREQIQNIE